MLQRANWGADCIHYALRWCAKEWIISHAQLNSPFAIGRFFSCVIILSQASIVYLNALVAEQLTLTIFHWDMSYCDLWVFAMYMNLIHCLALARAVQCFYCLFLKKQMAKLLFKSPHNSVFQRLCSSPFCRRESTEAQRAQKATLSDEGNKVIILNNTQCVLFLSTSILLLFLLFWFGLVFVALLGLCLWKEFQD